jgi:hypothetical protein
LYKDCSHWKEKNKVVHDIQEATTANDVAHTILMLYVALEEDPQADHQFAMVEV